MKRLFFYLFATILFSLISCSQNSVTSSMSVMNQGLKTPETIYSTKSELDEIYTKGDNALNWKMARFLAYDEFLSVETENGWQGAKLSDSPIIIYSSDSSPKYYEFRVIKNGLEIGAITANIYPKGSAIAYVMNFVRDYTKATSKGINGKIIDNGYPSIAFGVIGKSGDMVSSLVSEDGKSVISEEPGDVVELANKYGIAEISAQLGITESEVNNLIKDRKNTLNTMESDFKLMNEALANVENLSDDEIVNMLEGTKGSYTVTRKLQAYANIEKYFFGGACGPSALAWIYYGLYKTYKNKAIEFYHAVDNRYWDKDPSDIVNDLTKVLKTTSDGFTGPVELGNGFRTVTSQQYTTGWLLWPGTTFNYMQKSNLPLVSLRTSRWNNGVKDWPWHYRVIYGTREERREHKFLWWRWTTSHNQMIYMHDNTSDTPSGANFFMEAANNWDIAHFPVKSR